MSRLKNKASTADENPRGENPSLGGPKVVERVTESAELSKGRPLDGLSLGDMLAKLDMQLEYVPQDNRAEGLTSEAEEHYKAQLERLLAFIEGLQHEKRLLEQRIQTLEADREWRPWRRREEKRERKDGQVQRKDPSLTQR